MNWFQRLLTEPSVAHSALIFAIAISGGLAIGNIRFFGVSLGVGGVLFAGMLLGHLHLVVVPEILDFTRDFGLMLFVYAIGLQVGPGFTSSLKRQGLPMNLLAAAIVTGGTLIAVIIGLTGGAPLSAAIGMLTGAVTNTPSLGAAQQALKDILTDPTDATQLLGLGYAVAYPFGILGIILSMILIRRIFRIDPQKEIIEFEKLAHSEIKPLLVKSYEVTNPNLDGKTVGQLLALAGQGIVISRIMRRSEQQLASETSILRLNDVIVGVASAERLEDFRVIVGKESSVELTSLPSPIATRRVIVTRKIHVGKTLGELELVSRMGVVITRVVRSGVEFAPTRNMTVQFGDRFVMVGVEQSLDQAAKELGDSLKELDTPHIIPVFVGLALGVLLGSLPIAVPGIPAPLKLGLAGGPLLVAILLSRLGKVGPILSYMPNAAKMLLRDLGISLFLACVGLKSGERIGAILLEGPGLRWMLLGCLITFIPIFTVGIIARAWRKMNYVEICGLMAGSMTDPPALAFAGQMIGSDAPSIAYATVYPMTMLLRVTAAQLLVILLMH